MSKGLFITGTGTDVGKTFVTGLIVKKIKDSGVNAAYYKAALSGNERLEDGSLIPGDAQHVRVTAGLKQPLSSMCPYVYEHAVSPHLAARMEGNPIEMDVVKQGFSNLMGDYDYITAEGSGGIVCPLRFDEQKIFLEDVIRAVGIPAVIVADSGLGTINAVVLTIAYMKNAGIPIKGIFYNHFHPGDVMEEDNIRMCSLLTGLPELARIQDGDTDLNMDTDRLLSLYETPTGGF